MSLQCLSADMPTVEASMNVPGGEIAMDCEDVRVFCQAQGSNLNLNGFSLKTFAANGALTSTQSLPYLPTFTAAFGDPGSSFLRFGCSVYSLMNPAIDLQGGVLAQANAF